MIISTPFGMFLTCSPFARHKGGMWSASENKIPKEQIQRAHVDTLIQGVYDLKNCEDFDPDTLTEALNWLEANTSHQYKISLFKSALKCITAGKPIAIDIEKLTENLRKV